MNSVKEALRGDIVKKLDKSTYTGNAQNLKNDIDGKEPTFSKNSAFNKSFGVANNEVLEGAKLAETLGIEYGGILNNNSTKIAGKAYYCTANRSIYKCTSNTTLNYTDAGYFIAISNDDLLGKLQNLIDFNQPTIQIGEYFDVEYSENKLLNIMLIRIISKKTIPGGFSARIEGIPKYYKQQEFVVTGNANTTRAFRYSPTGVILSFESSHDLNPSFFGNCLLFKKS